MEGLEIDKDNINRDRKDIDNEVNEIVRNKIINDIKKVKYNNKKDIEVERDIEREVEEERKWVEKENRIEKGEGNEKVEDDYELRSVFDEEVVEREDFDMD